MATRRDVLRTAGSALAAGATVALLTGPSAAEHMDEPGENITLEYDVDTLETYRPRLVLPTEAREKFNSLYGWVARSPDFETDVCCYWASYTHQEGLLGNLDSHFGDHEPVQVEVGSDTGDVERVRASVYHWMKGEVTADAAPMYDETHPHLRVIEPWHQYTAPNPADSGAFFDVEDLTAAFPRWLDNGLEEDLHPGSTTVPWRMRDRESWWRDTVGSFSVDAAVVSAARRIGLDQEGDLHA